MNIIVVGDGKIGLTLIEHLVAEGHDIVIIDNNAQVVDEIINEYDVKGVCGNGAAYDVQVEAGAEKADLLISATSSDEVNILACLVAKKLGVNQTIARVRNPEYTKQTYSMREELGLSMAVNPELDAAREISRILRFPSAVKVDSFANDKVDLVEIKIEDSSPLANKSLFKIHAKYQIRILVCAIQREDKVFIPKGDFTIQAGDKLYITGTPLEITMFCRIVGIFKEKIKNALVIGGGRIAYYLAILLKDLGINLTIIEKDAKRCEELCKDIPYALIINGDGTDQKILLEERIEKMDALVTLTGYDEENIIVSMFAQSIGVDKIVTKINRKNYYTILEKAGLDSIISPGVVSSNHIVRYVRGMESSQDTHCTTLYRLVNNQVEALEYYIPTDAEYTMIPLKELKIKENILLASIIRNNNVIIPNGDDMIMSHDSIIIITTNSKIRDVKDILK